MAKLFAFKEDSFYFHYELCEQNILGRDPECDLILFGQGVAPRHAEIFMVEDDYYIANLGSPESTFVNHEAIMLQTRLRPFDSIAIGSESFIFEPGVTVIAGSTNATIIIEALNENVHNLVTLPVEEAACQVSPEDIPALMTLIHQLNRIADPLEMKALILRYLRKRFGITFMTLLWPALPPVKRLISLMSSHEEKMLILNQTPFLLVTRDHMVTLWPNSISSLYFQEGRRKIGLTGKPVLVGPLDDGAGQRGLMYLENMDKDFTENDLKTFAAFLGLVNSTFNCWCNLGYKRIDTEMHNLNSSHLTVSSSSYQVKAVFATAAQAAVEPGSIFIGGEAGTGKAVLAEYVHQSSLRRNCRFVPINLALLSPGAMERTFFGQAVTSDDSVQTGLFELADGGTLFLQHVSCLPLSIQESVLRVIENKLYFPTGATRPKATDIRIITSSSADLWAMVEAGTFRKDLYLRLTKMNIIMPPLREIKNEIEKFLALFLKKEAQKLGLPYSGLDKAALECLQMYNWPGNMTELEAEAKLLVMFSRNGWVAMEDLPLHLRLSPEVFGDYETEIQDPIIMEAERYHLASTMACCGGDLEKVTSVLNQKPEKIIQKMRTCGVDPINYQPPREQNGFVSNKY